MVHSLKTLVLIVVVGALSVQAGCGKPSGGTMPAKTEAAAELAKLDAFDRDAAEKQATCPVSDHALGSMGVPIKVTHDGKDYFLCCEMCREGFEKEPAKFVAKLKK